tara:strand:+ start:1472 stop:2605 length:1134 start_codon:yes stop_codon:yes gene_type:complete
MAYTTIDDPSAQFQTALWSGDDATTQNITNDGNSDLQPDWVWVKCRNTAGNGFDHTVWDTSRGVSNSVNTGLSPSQSDSEGLGDNVTTTAQLGGVSAMLSDGFTVREGTADNDSRYVNENSRTYVGWQWKANGGTTTTNDASSTSVGSIDSVYQANTTAGFSIVTYTGTGSTATVAHGLGVVPDVLLFKKRNAVDNWYMYHSANTSAPETDYLVLDTTDATTDFNIWNDTSPTSTVFSISNAGVHADGKTMVCYAFAEKQGYSKFGKYTGNGLADGAFVYTGFKPAWVMTKETGATGAWYMHDTKRDPSNGATHQLIANTNEVEYDTGSDVNIDILSNGFKQRYAGGSQNGDGDTHIYMAFAESPFVSSKGVPTTAR